MDAIPNRLWQNFTRLMCERSFEDTYLDFA
jgi:hypothetical protein